MQHRHLTHQAFSLAAIDDIIERGRRPEWRKLRDAASQDHALYAKILRVCQRHHEDAYAQRYHLWRNYAIRRIA